MMSVLNRINRPFLRAVLPLAARPSLAAISGTRPTFSSTSRQLESKPGKTVKSGLHQVDRAASKAALKGIDVGMAATKKTKKTLGINGNGKTNGQKGKNGKNGKNGAKKNGNGAKENGNGGKK